VNKQDIESSQSVPLENTTKWITLNEELAGQIRKQIGLDCEAPKLARFKLSISDIIDIIFLQYF
jgi:hypothetical protein